MTPHNSSIVVILTVIIFSNFLVTSSSSKKTSVTCDNKQWRTVYYESIGVPPPEKSFKGLRADGKSCLTIPINYKADYKLLIPVYMNVLDDNSGLNISLFKEDDHRPYTTYNYRDNNVFGVEWNYLIIAIDVQTTTRVNIQGQNNERELILLDSYEYAPIDNIIISNEYNVVVFSRKDNILIDDSSEVSGPEFFSDMIEGSGSGGESGDGEDKSEEEEDNTSEEEEDDTSEKEEEESEEENESEETETQTPEDPFWNPVTVSLVAVGSVVGVGLIIGAVLFVIAL